MAQPTTQPTTIDAVLDDLEEFVTEVAARRARYLVDRDGSPVAALVSVADLQRLERIDRQRSQAFETMQRLGAATAGVPEDELEARIDEAVAEARAERRAERRSA